MSERWVLECRDEGAIKNLNGKKLLWIGPHDESIGKVLGRAVADDPCWRSDHHARRWNIGDPDVIGPICV